MRHFSPSASALPVPTLSRDFSLSASIKTAAHATLGPLLRATIAALAKPELPTPPRPAPDVSGDEEELALLNQELDHSYLWLDGTLNSMRQGALLLDSGRQVVLCNDRMRQLYNFDADIVRPGTPLTQVLQHSLDKGNYPGTTLQQLIAKVEKKLSAPGLGVSYQRTLVNGRWMSIGWTPIASGGWLCTCDDITETIKANERAAHLAGHDAITGLPNRNGLHAAILSTWPSGERGTDAGFNLLCLEIDRFQTVCDTCGHRVGDALLRHVAERLRSCMRGTDLLAHLGGASFAILQRGVLATEVAMPLATRLQEAVQSRVPIEGRIIMPTISVGIAAAGEGAPSSAYRAASTVLPQTGADEILRNATLALHRAVSEGGGIVRLYAPDMDRSAQDRHALEIDLQGALAADQFELHYQPLVSVNERRVTCFEALLRWNHPDRGPVSPAVFIPLAEELGLIGAIGAWVLRAACQEASRWPDDVNVAVNLSPLQFADTSGPSLLQSVTGILAETGLPGRRLELEITESVRLQEDAETLAMLHSLRDLGVRIALDDFGTGYSSLSYLRCFPFDKLKIDQSFVRELPAAGSVAIVRAVIGLGTSLGMSVVAEGVETSAQLNALVAETCDELQGYLLSKPRPAVDIPILLQTTPSRC